MRLLTNELVCGPFKNSVSQCPIALYSSYTQSLLIFTARCYGLFGFFLAPLPLDEKLSVGLGPLDAQGIPLKLRYPF